MSKNIIIQEGGIGKQLTADKLKTNLVGGGSCLWVPEDGTRLGTKHITEDGTYRASDDGYYGYSEVSVSGIGTATGTGPDGEDHSYTEDGTGGVTDTILPYSISVVTPPTVTTYADGATIDFSGMVVKAYLKSGGLWTDSTHPNGVIPISELTLPVTKADKDEIHSDEYSDGQGINAMLVSYTEVWNKAWNPIHHRPDPSADYHRFVSQVLGTSNGGNPAMLGDKNNPNQFYASLYNGTVYAWGATGSSKLDGYEDTGNEYDRISVWEGTSKTISPNELIKMNRSWITGLPSSSAEPTGNETLSPVDAYQTIPVQYLRSGGKTLESSFNITVT